MTHKARWLAMFATGLLVGCGDAHRDEMIATFGPSAGSEGGDDDDGHGDDDEADDGSNDDGDDGDTGSAGDDTDGGGDDSGPTYACEIVLGCHDGAPVPGAGVTSQIPVGCGDGVFVAMQSFDVASFADPEAPRSMPLLGDLDGDGDLDLAINFRKAGVGLVFAGSGAGSFEPSPASLAGGIFAGGWGGDLGDFSGDGRLDVVFGDHARSARAWVSNGAMSFSESRAGLPDSPLFSGAGVADLDGDGNLDALFGADQFSSGLLLFAGDGAGNWSAAPAPPLAGKNLGHFAFGDVDDDGDLDIVAFGKGGGPGVTAYVLRNDGGGAFSSIAQMTGGESPMLADPVQGSLGDVDCDGDLDIAAGGSIHLANGGTWTLGANVDVSQVSHLADMNGDGHLDLVTHHPSVGIALYLGDGSGTNWTRDLQSGLPSAEDGAHGVVMNDAYGIDIGDLNGNDALDIVRVAGFGATYFVDVYVR